ncbi:MAG: hypothetical protein ACTSPC_13650 [Candidatus Heimdallarchaeota archaeon]
MKKIFLMLFMMAALPSIAQEEPSDSIKTYDKSDLVITAGATMLTTGLIYYFTASRTVGIVSMTTGGIVTITGTILKIRNKRRNGNRGS